MKVLLQRVNHASVIVDDKIVGRINRGLLLLVGFGADDTAALLQPFCRKIAQLRLFPDQARSFHLSLLEVGGEVLLVPQFTLYADTAKGRRPEFFAALRPDLATDLFDRFVGCFRELNIASVQTGTFGAHMKVSLENDGPVTLMIEAP
jgi:D-aminoacyl-tRNA deacylase